MVGLIFDTSISPRTMIDTVVESSNEKTFRSMIFDGICKYYKRTKDFTFIQNIHDKLMVHKKCSNTTHTDDAKRASVNMYRNQSEFFSVDDLICKTMQYLDFYSLISCRLVNKSFLYLTYNTSSTRYLDIGIDNPKSVNELLRFKQISTIELEPWRPKFNNLFKYLSTFTKLSNITIAGRVSKNGYLDRFGKLSVEMIKNNKDNITSMTLTSDSYEKRDIPIEMTNGLADCKHLEELEISNGRLCSSCNINDKDNYNDKLVNLKLLQLDNVSVDLSLFRSLLQLNMCTLETLILNNIVITTDSETIDTNVKIDVNPKFLNIKRLILGESNGDWHNGLLNKIQSGSKLESMELSLCQISKKVGQKNDDENVNVNYNNTIKFDKLQELLISPSDEDNLENSIYDGLARVGYLTKFKMDDSHFTNVDDDELFTYISDIQTFGIEVDGDRLDIIGCFSTLNKIKFTKLKSLIFHSKLRSNFAYHYCDSEPTSDYFKQLLHQINIVDKFVGSNQFKFTNIQHTGYHNGKSCQTVYCYDVSLGTSRCHKEPSKIDSLLNKKNEWDKVGSIMSKWCNYTNKCNADTYKDTEKNSNCIDYSDDGLKLGFKFEFKIYVNLGYDVDKVNGNTLCQKVKWINTMINSLAISENTIDFGDMITKNIYHVDKFDIWAGCGGGTGGYNTISKFDIQLNSCVAINGMIKEQDQHCCFKMTVVINLSLL